MTFSLIKIFNRKHYFYVNALEISQDSHLNSASSHLSMKQL